MMTTSKRVRRTSKFLVDAHEGHDPRRHRRLAVRHELPGLGDQLGDAGLLAGSGAEAPLRVEPADEGLAVPRRLRELVAPGARLDQLDGDLAQLRRELLDPRLERGRAVLLALGELLGQRSPQPGLGDVARQRGAAVPAVTAADGGRPRRRGRFQP
jgi:hypothetical protein